MVEEQFSILNDAGLAIYGTTYRPTAKGKFPVIILAGDFFDTSESANLKEMTRYLLEAGFAVTRFDFTNSYGQSEGHGSDTTISQRAHDLEYVIEHVKRRAYVNTEKISLIGFGFGAMAVLVLEGFKGLAKSVVLIDCPKDVTGSSWTSFDEREMFRVRLKRYFHVPMEGEEVRINYTFFEDGERIDMARCARNMTTPVLYIAGKENGVILPENSVWLFDRTAGEKDIQLLDSIGHVNSRKGIKAIIDLTLKWLKKSKAA